MPLYMLSVFNLMTPCLDVDPVEDSDDFGSAGANPADHSKINPEKSFEAVC